MSYVQQILIAALIFIPLERLLALHRERRILRDGLLVDVIHVFATGALIRVGLTLVLVATAAYLQQVVPFAWRATVASQPIILQFFEILLIADLGFYLVHRAFHRFPVLWRFHVVHHSIEQLDWVAAHRVHPIDQILTKAGGLIPVFVLGFDPPAILAFAVCYHWHSLLIHANVRLGFGPLRWLIASPQFHHWHHANQEEALDRNFAGQLPLWDIVFGTLYMPKGKMPDRYGVSDPVPKSYLGQLAYPFLFSRRRGRRIKRPSAHARQAATIATANAPVGRRTDS